MLYVPKSNIKFYTAPTGGSEVISGSPGSVNIYPRIIFPFYEQQTGFYFTNGYFGNDKLGNIKTFNPAGGAPKEVEVSMGGYGDIYFDISSLNTDSVIDYDWYDDIIISGNAQTMYFNFRTNANQFGVFDGFATLFDAEMSVSENSELYYSWINQEQFIPHYSGSSFGLGQLCQYMASMVLNIPVNNSIYQVSRGTINIKSNNVVLASYTIKQNGTSRLKFQVDNRSSYDANMSMTASSSYSPYWAESEMYSLSGTNSLEIYIHGRTRLSDTFTITISYSGTVNKKINMSGDSGYIGGYNSSNRGSAQFSVPADLLNNSEKFFWIYLD